MSNSSPINSVERALLLVCMLRDRGQLRVQQVANELEVAPSTAHRLLTALVASGFAMQGAGRVYLPGPQLKQLPRRPTKRELASSCRPYLIALSAEVGETVHLMVLEGASSRFVDGVEGSQAVRVAQRSGMVLPAHVTSGGKALLAELDHGQLSALFSSGLALRPDARGPNVSALRRELAVVRRRGYAINVEQSESGVNAIGVCIRDSVGRAIAAIVVATPSSRVQARHLVNFLPALAETARDVGVAVS